MAYMSNIEEIWKDIKGYETLYQISNKGRVKSYDRTLKNICGVYIRKGRILKQTDDNKGYLQVVLYNGIKRKTFKTHKLVAENFLDKSNYKKMETEKNVNINKLQVNHIKEFEKYNNCVDNLEWCTQLYNCNYGTRNKRVNSWKNRNRKRR